MDRATVLFASGVALGAIVGAATSHLLGAAGPADPAAPSAQQQDLTKLGTVFEEALARALRRTSRDRAPDRPASAAEPVPAASPADTERLDAVVEILSRTAATDAHAEIVRPSDAFTQEADALPPKNTARLNALVVRSRAAEARRRQEWLFQSEAAVARTFGAPDEVSKRKDDGVEVWEYYIPFVNADGEQDSWGIDFEFSRGRVIDVGGAEEIPEDE